ncbi:MAG: sigma-70 family RNA polymerase sigma factor [Pseudomonadota bacterium]
METSPEQIELFDEAVRDHGALVARIVSSYEARAALAEELAQETFTALWRALPAWRGEASMRTFLARIAHNVCVSHVRREVRRTDTEIDDQTPSAADSPETVAGRNLERTRLLEAVSALPLAQRQVVTLHLEGFTDREVGETLGISEGNVGVRLTRARTRLRALMGVAS